MKVTKKEIATGLYVPIQEASKKPINSDGKELLDKDERALLLLSHVCFLLKNNDLNEVIPILKSIFAQKQNGGQEVDMSSLQNSIEDIQSFFAELPDESHKFFKQDFLFNKNFNPQQKTLVLAWYKEYTKAIDNIFQDVMKEVEVSD